MEKIHYILLFSYFIGINTSLSAQTGWDNVEKAIDFNTGLLTDSSEDCWRKHGFQVKFADILVAPNPVMDKLELWVPNNMGQASIQIQALDGAVVQQTIATGPRMQLSVRTLVPGAYRLVLLGNERFCSGEFIKL